MRAPNDFRKSYSTEMVFVFWFRPRKPPVVSWAKSAPLLLLCLPNWVSLAGTRASGVALLPRQPIAGISRNGVNPVCPGSTVAADRVPTLATAAHSVVVKNVGVRQAK